VFAKLMIGAVAVLAAALFAYLEQAMIAAYGTARYQAGLAEGRLQQLPQILSANQAAAKAGLDARDHIIAAETAHAGEAARLAALVERSQDEVRAYEASDAGRASCIGAERVRAIGASRAALFPAAPAVPAGGGGP
jgi:hypothetical protein